MDMEENWTQLNHKNLTLPLACSNSWRISPIQSPIPLLNLAILYHQSSNKSMLVRSASTKGESLIFLCYKGNEFHRCKLMETMFSVSGPTKLFGSVTSHNSITS
jgi:hypothetical protein